MLIIPSIDGNNLAKCSSISRVLRGFVSLINLRIDKSSVNLEELIRLFNKQNFELELSFNSENDQEILTKILTAHSDVNIGKVYFYSNNENNIEQDITNVRIFGIQPGLLINDLNYKKGAIVNKFEYSTINTLLTPNYIEVYKHVKENNYKGNLFLDFTNQVIDEKEIKEYSWVDGIYFDVTNNPRIKDTVSLYRRTANSIYFN